MDTSLFNLSTTYLQSFLLLMMLALLLGILLGIERISVHKTAGMRTYGLVAMASAFFVLIARMTIQHAGITDMSIVLQFGAHIIAGVGFLGAGLIIFKDNQVQNITTAAGMWMCAAIGIAVGFGFVWYACVATFLTFLTLRLLSLIERRMRLKYFPDPVFIQEEHKKEIERKDAIQSTVKKIAKSTKTKKPAAK